MALNVKTAQELVNSNLIVRHYAGSRSYGTALPTSDTDIRGVFIAEPVNIRTPFFPIREANLADEEDTVLYELNQFMKLCTECNPNVIETLWVREQDITESTVGYQVLRNGRDKLLSKKIAFTTSGYALSQLKRIKGHNRWLTNPQPAECPQQKDYVSLVHNFTPNKVLAHDFYELFIKSREDHRLVPFGGNIFGIYWAPGKNLFDNSGTLISEFEEGEAHKLGTPLMLVRFLKDQHEQQHTVWKNYWQWKRERNVVRSALEEQHGYDTKHAMHLVRLLRMGAEALQTGEVNVFRPDHEELLSIRAGAWTYERVVEYAVEMDNWIQNELYQKSELRKAPDVKAAAEMMLHVQDLMWGLRGA